MFARFSGHGNSIHNIIPVLKKQKENVHQINIINKYWYTSTKANQKFCNILVCASLRHICYMTEAVQAKVVPIMVGCIMVVDLLICCALLHSAWNLKAAQMQWNLIWELHEFKIGHNTSETTKYFSGAKSEGIVDNNTVDNSTAGDNNTVDNSTVDNSTAVDHCTVDNNTVDNNTVDNSTAGDNNTNDNSMVDNSTAVDHSTVDNSTVDNNTVDNSTAGDNNTNDNSMVDNSTAVDHSTVDNSTVDNNTVDYNTAGDHSTVDNSTAVDNSTVTRGSVLPGFQERWHQLKSGKSKTVDFKAML